MKVIKKLVYLITKGNRLEIIVYSILVLVLLFFFSTSELIDMTTFSSVVIVALIGIFVRILGKWLYNMVEDSIKLTNNYDDLNDRYFMEEKFSIKNGEEIIEYPVVKISDLYNKTIQIIDNKESVYEIPPFVLSNYDKLINSHKTSNIYNNPNIRVDNWEEKENGQFCIFTGRTTYFNSLVTNRSMDFDLGSHLSIREIYECGPYINSLKESALSNHLGFNGLVESSDGYFVFIDRGKNVSIGKKTLGTSVAASLKVKYALNAKKEFDRNGLINSILSELKDELSIKENEICMNDTGRVTIISAYRDLVEGGKPQLLFYVRSTKTKEEIEMDFLLNIYSKKKQKESNSEDDQNNDLMKSKQELKMKTDGNNLIWISKDELLNGHIQFFPDKMIYNNRKYDMVPSTSASVVMVIEWLKKDRGI